jgi:putative transcriptional regulator
VVTAYAPRLKELRIRQGLSQDALARKVGVSRQTIVNIENGNSQPRVMLAIALAGILAVAVVELFAKDSQ